MIRDALMIRIQGCALSKYIIQAPLSDQCRLRGWPLPFISMFSFNLRSVFGNRKLCHVTLKIWPCTKKNCCMFSPQNTYKYLWVFGVCQVSGLVKEIKARYNGNANKYQLLYLLYMK